MVSYLVFYQLGLIALVCLFLMLSGLWPSAPAAARPMTPKPLLPRCKHSKVVFQKWRWPCLHCPSKGIAVDKQANDDVVHLCCFRKADGLADQAFNARP